MHILKLVAPFSIMIKKVNMVFMVNLWQLKILKTCSGNENASIKKRKRSTSAEKLNTSMRMNVKWKKILINGKDADFQNMIRISMMNFWEIGMPRQINISIRKKEMRILIMIHKIILLPKEILNKGRKVLLLVKIVHGSLIITMSKHHQKMVAASTSNTIQT